jgi:hypothetical protein
MVRFDLLSNVCGLSLHKQLATNGFFGRVSLLRMNEDVSRAMIDEDGTARVAMC